MLARVLAVVDETWAGTSLAPALGEFIERRVAAGDTARGVEVGFDALGEPVIRDAVAGVGAEARDAVSALLQAWRARDLDLDYFASVGRLVELDAGRHRCSSARGRPSSTSSRLPSARSRRAP